MLLVFVSLCVFFTSLAFAVGVIWDNEGVERVQNGESMRAGQGL